VTRVTTARIQDGALVTLGESPDIAPTEQLRAARFLGDRAYLVTFFQVDPLFVVDLADPAHPRALGTVELPGFSEYLQPLDAGHLLTIGRDVRDGRLLGVALRLFDVADPTAPALTAEYVLPPDASTPAETDHLAFTYDALGLLALPVDRYEPGLRATLDVLAVDPAGAIDLRGTVDHGAAAFVPCPPPYEFEGCQTYESMLRGLFIGDAVYSLSTTTLQVHALDDLATPLATVRLR
jgi:hypothetical protein